MVITKDAIIAALDALKTNGILGEKWHIRDTRDGFAVLCGETGVCITPRMLIDAIGYVGCAEDFLTLHIIPKILVIGA